MILANLRHSNSNISELRSSRNIQKFSFVWDEASAYIRRRSSENAQIVFLDVRLSTAHAIYRAEINRPSAKNEITGLEYFLLLHCISY
jgi:hypothetical protein